MDDITFQVINGHIGGKIDQQAAMIQTIDKILRTPRVVYPIYSDQYGHDLEDLFGKPFPYAEVEAQRMVKEALLADGRVTSVSFDQVEKINTETLMLNGSCTTVYGNVPIKSEVRISESQ